MDMRQAFPSKWLKASDLPEDGRPVVVTMSHVVMEKIGDEDKPVLYFNGKKKGLGLNITNCRSIEKLFGFKTEAWKGQKIELYKTTTEYRGDTVDCVRVRAHANAAPPPPAAEPEPEPDLPPASEDDHPF